MVSSKNLSLRQTIEPSFEAQKGDAKADVDAGRSTSVDLRERDSWL